MNVTSIHEDIQAQWFCFDSLVQILGVSARTARTRLSGVDPRLVRYDHKPGQQGGRPEHHYHYSCLPELTAYYRMHVAEPAKVEATKAEAAGMQPDDLERAKLRLTCVLEYQARVKSMPAAEAAELTARDWSARPREQLVRISERLPEGFLRKREINVTLGRVKPSTIQTWERLYKRNKRLSDLALSKKGRSGRASLPIPDELLWYVLGNAVDTARADVVKAVAFAQATWTATPFPDVSIRTWQRRIAAADPAKVMACLGKKGVAAFRNEASPDIERDWLQLSYNELWEIDDVQMDFYCHRQSNPEELCRPYLYAIMRVASREWVSFVVSEEPITHRQVGGLLGYAFSRPEGGLPEHMTFERGKVALSETLAGTLDLLGVKWHRASVDGGRTWSGALPDAPKGHSRAKAVLESNNRRLHAALWRMASQIGTEERHTAKANTETLKSESIRRVKAGLPSILPLWHDARKFIDAAVLQCNSTPQHGLPRMWDSEARKWRRYTPAEYGRALAQEATLRVMDSYMIPSFYQDGKMVEVTKNGVQLGVDRATGRRRWFGRSDADLDALRGNKVTCYVLDEFPDHCYVAELGRTVARYELESPHGNSQFAAKARTDRVYRQRFEQLASDRNRHEQEFIEGAVAMAAEQNVPQERIISVTDEQLRQRTATVVRAGMQQAATEADIAERTAIPTGEAKVMGGERPREPKRRRSILDLAGPGEQFAGQPLPPAAEEDETETHEMEKTA